jgi:hypothetical protein
MVPLPAPAWSDTAHAKIVMRRIVIRALMLVGNAARPSRELFKYGYSVQITLFGLFHPCSSHHSIHGFMVEFDEPSCRTTL